MNTDLKIRLVYIKQARKEIEDLNQKLDFAERRLKEHLEKVPEGLELSTIQKQVIKHLSSKTEHILINNTIDYFIVENTGKEIKIENWYDLHDSLITERTRLININLRRNHSIVVGLVAAINVVSARIDGKLLNYSLDT